MLLNQKTKQTGNKKKRFCVDYVTIKPVLQSAKGSISRQVLGTVLGFWFVEFKREEEEVKGHQCVQGVVRVRL